MIPTYAPRQSYTGNGAVSAYTFNFKILSLDQLLVVVMNAAGAQTGSYRGTDTSFISNVVYDPDLGGGTVNLLAVLPTNSKIILLLADDAPTQPQRWRERSGFTMRLIEVGMDRAMGAIQRIAYRAGRSVQLHESDNLASFNPTLPPGMGTLPASFNAIPVTAVDGTGWGPVTSWVPKPLLQQAIDAAAAAVLSASASAQAAANSAASAIAAAGSTVDSSAQAAAAIAAASAAATSASTATTAAGTATGASAAASNFATTATNAATAAGTSATNAAASALAAGNAQTLADTARTNAQNSATAAAQSATDAAASAAAAAGGAAAPTIVGSYASAQAIGAGTGIPFSSGTYPNMIFVKGSGGPVDVTKVPQIANGTNVGQRLAIIGTDSVNTVRLHDGDGIKLRGQGEVIFFADMAIEFMWTGNAWSEL